MKAGHVFTIEPMINLGAPGDTTWGDNWTAVTTDGKCRYMSIFIEISYRTNYKLKSFSFILITLHMHVLVMVGKRSAQFEHTILVTEKGFEILTAREDEPVMCWNEDLINR